MNHDRTLDQAMGMDIASELDARLDQLAEQHQPHRVTVCPCGSTSFSGDEAPIATLPGGLATVIRWRCDGCDARHYDDVALAQLRARLAGAQAALAAVKEAGWHRPEDEDGQA